MSKMNKLASVIDDLITSGEGILKAVQDLTSCAQGIVNAAKELKEIFSTENLPEPKALSVVEPAAVKTKTFTKEDVRGILAAKSASGYGKEVKALLSKYGADKLSAVESKDYASIVAEAEVIGNE